MDSKEKVLKYEILDVVATFFISRITNNDHAIVDKDARKMKRLVQQEIMIGACMDLTPVYDLI